ncbi:MAG: hypothetical protein AB7F19_01915 [Candidatus Babeliales bacterium]
MYTYLLFALLSVSYSTIAMHLQPGQSITWHTRQYQVTERIEKNNQITIVMARDTHHLGNVPLRTESITRIFTLDNNDPTITSGTSAFSPQAVNTLKVISFVGILAACTLLAK